MAPKKSPIKPAKKAPIKSVKKTPSKSVIFNEFFNIIKTNTLAWAKHNGYIAENKPDEKTQELSTKADNVRHVLSREDWGCYEERVISLCEALLGEKLGLEKPSKNGGRIRSIDTEAYKVDKFVALIATEDNCMFGVDTFLLCLSSNYFKETVVFLSFSSSPDNPKAEITFQDCDSIDGDHDAYSIPSDDQISLITNVYLKSQLNLS